MTSFFELGLGGISLSWVAIERFGGNWVEMLGEPSPQQRASLSVDRLAS